MWKTINTLEARLAQGLEGTDRVDVLNRLAWRLRGLDSSRADQYLEESTQLSEELEYENGLAQAWLTQTFVQTLRGGMDTDRLERLQSIINTFRNNKNVSAYAMALGLKSLFSWRISDRESAFKLIYEALELMRDSPYRDFWGWCESILGGYYIDLQDFKTALPHIQRAEELFEAEEELAGLASCVNNRGVIHRMLGELELALLCHERGKEIALSIGQQDVLGRTLREIGRVFEDMGELVDARLHLEESLKVRKDIKNRPGIITSLTDLGRISARLEDYEQAEQYLFVARKKAHDMDAKGKLVDIYYEQAQLYKLANEPALALKHYEEYMEQKNLVEGEQSVLRLKNLQAVFEIERSHKEAEIERLRNVELRQLVEQVEKQQEDMLASIRYARNIQDAILPPIPSIESRLPGGFVFYYPKDIVSGDFYWYTEVDGLDLLAAVDCTGHGVPGAFMVVLSNTLLNEIVQRDLIVEPTQILEELDTRLTHILQQRDAEHASYDGLDIALVQRDPIEGRVKFAGAKRPMICVRGGEVYRIKGSRSSIGGWVGEEHLAKEFEQVEWISQPEDRFFLFSDGFADQFGGPEGKKYGVKRFREQLRNLPLEPRHTKQALQEVHLQWRGTEPQTDDLVVMGWQEPCR
ncbi:MAG TPA: hypothetical protein DCE41_16620 [Cytophagales bacterium]|nr:hypothetical protein [Cytophagales bacterium]HAA17637.1 hypothetical protein [Cytophagales bacterium]HAP63947.1 hypothetical protein [Cytophagales bacterium]